jgi:hypothetical protein
MSDWLLYIIKSEFLWGIVLGLCIALIGARVQAKQQIKKLVEQQRKDYLLFAQDIISNIMRVSDDIEEARRRSLAIHHDLLALIDAEVGIFGRNRELSIRLNDDLRGNVRKYVTDIALRRTDIAVALNDFERQMILARDLRANGDATGGSRVEQSASIGPLAKANLAADDLIATAKTGSEIITKLQAHK